MSIRSKSLLLLYFIVLVLISITSCTLKNNPEKTSELLQEAERKIHLSQYSEAEADLKMILKKEPKNSRARIILASLYVHRAGIRVDDHIHLEEIINSKPSSTQTYIQNSLIKKFSQSSDENLNEFSEILVQLNNVLIQMHTWQEKLNHLPSLNSQQASDLLLAIKTLSILSSVTIKGDQELPISISDEETTEGMILYRSVVKIYLFKYLWNSDSFLPVSNRRICESSLASLKRGTQNLEIYVEDLLNDFSIGLPKEKEKTISQLNTFKTATKQIQDWLDSLPPEAETMAQLIKEQIEHEGVRCNF